MKEKWEALNLKEKRLVMLMGAFLLLLALYHLIWQPLNNGVSSTEKSIKRQQALLSWVKTNTTFYTDNVGNVDTEGHDSLSRIVNQSAQKKQIQIARIQPQNNALQVSIDKVPFNVLMAWLHDLSFKENVSVLNFDISKSDDAGVVSVRRLTLGKS
jgi:general secretion pathway protein M